jgi:hypothetical protein
MEKPQLGQQEQELLLLSFLLPKYEVLVRPDVSTAVTQRILVFWDMTVCCWVGVSSNISKEHTTLTQGSVMCQKTWML